MNKLKSIDFNEHYPYFGPLLLTENILYLIWGPLINILYPNYIDPWWVRALYVLFFGAVVYFNKVKPTAVNRHFYVILFMFLIALHLPILGMINNDIVLYNLILIPCAILMGTITFDLRAVILWCLLANVIMIISLYVNYSVNGIIIFLYLITASIVAVIICINRREILFSIMEKNRELSEQRALAVYATKMSTIGEIATGIAHEINNPLTIINGHVDKMSKNLDEEFDRDLFVKSISKIKKAVQRSKNIVDSLGTFAKNTAQEKSEKVDANTIINESLALAKTKIHSSSIKLEVSKIENAVYVDVNLIDMSQVLLNLLLNAFDAVCDLDHPWIKINVYSYNDSVFIRVTDSGQGIEQKVVEQMMDPFFSTKVGTGLGLSTSKNIVEKYKGTLKYVPLDGHTSFIVELPKT